MKDKKCQNLVSIFFVNTHDKIDDADERWWWVVWCMVLALKQQQHQPTKSHFNCVYYFILVGWCTHTHTHKQYDVKHTNRFRMWNGWVSNAEYLPSLILKQQPKHALILLNIVHIFFFFLSSRPVWRMYILYVHFHFFFSSSFVHTFILFGWSQQTTPRRLLTYAGVLLTLLR